LFNNYQNADKNRNEETRDFFVGQYKGAATTETSRIVDLIVRRNKVKVIQIKYLIQEKYNLLVMQKMP